MADVNVLTVQYNNKAPVELSDLASSLGALSEAYREYAELTTGAWPDNHKLYVKEIRPGSIIAQLIEFSDQARLVIEHIDVLGGFVTQMDDLIRFFLGEKRKSESSHSRANAERLFQIVQPTAREGGSQFIMQVAGDLHININSVEANAVQNGIRRFTARRPLPSSTMFHDEILYLEQVRDAYSSKAGDRGVVEKYSPRAVKLAFASEHAKAAILDLEENPFHSFFIVDGEVTFVDGRPVLYKIYTVNDSFPRADGG